MKRVLCALMAAVMLFSLAACTNNNQPGDSQQPGTNQPNTNQPDNSNPGDPATVKIGVLTFLTGPSAELGRQVSEIYQMVADIINEEHPELTMAMAASAGIPSMNGAKIELVIADHKGDANTAVSEAKRLITEQHVVALAGEYTSALIKAVAAVTEQYQIP